MLSPHELLYNTPPDYTHLRTFGCSCFPWQRPLTTHKLQPCAPPCVFLGYSSTSKGYRCYDYHSGKIITSRHVIFDKLTFPLRSNTPPANITPPSPHLLLPTSCSITPSSLSDNYSPPSNPTHFSLQPTIPPEPPNPLPSPNNPTTTSPTSRNPSSTSPTIAPPPPQPPAPSHHMRTRLHSGISKPKKMFTLHHSVTSDPDLTCYTEASKHPHWCRAMPDKYLALQQQGTWRLVPPPSDHNIVGCRWTFKTKHHADGSVARHKARLVAQGFTQEYDIDYQDTFSPVARMATIRTFLTVAVTCKWPILQYDVSNSFLHGRLDVTIYMSQPPGFQDSQFPNHVCHLQKALYGLKQAPRLWYSTFSTSLRRHGFQVSSADPSLLLYHKDSIHIFLLIYVDDILITGDTPSTIATLLDHLNNQFRMKSLGSIHNFLGINISSTTTGLFLSQPTYLQHILTLSGFNNSKPVKTPLAIKITPKPDALLPFNHPTHYRRLTGALQYLTITRPDIAYAVNLLCQHMQEPTLYHFQLLK